MVTGFSLLDHKMHLTGMVAYTPRRVSRANEL
jgi:hypothetical protein